MEQTNTAGASPASARGVMDRLRTTATEQLSNQKDRATDGLGSVADAVRQTTQPLRDHQQDFIAQYVEKAADQIERLSGQLRHKDVSELVSDVQRFARRQPVVFIGVAFAAGVLAARFIKSSNNGPGTRNERTPTEWRGATTATATPQPEDRGPAPGRSTWSAPDATGGL